MSLVSYQHKINTTLSQLIIATLIPPHKQMFCGGFKIVLKQNILT